MDKIVRKFYQDAGIDPVWDAINDVSDKVDELVEFVNGLQKLAEKQEIVK